MTKLGYPRSSFTISVSTLMVGGPLKPSNVNNNSHTGTL